MGKTSNWVAPNVVSSYIKFIRWDEGDKLSVEFAGGKKFSYANVSKEKFKEFRDSESAGKWFHANIKTQEDKHPFSAIV